MYFKRVLMISTEADVHSRDCTTKKVARVHVYVNICVLVGLVLSREKYTVSLEHNVAYSPQFQC